MSRGKSCFNRLGFVLISMGILFLILNITSKKVYDPLMENFASNNDSSNSKDVKLVLFHWNKCGHCKKMMPDWGRLEKMYPNNTVKFEKDEISSEQESEFNIQGYPTICLMQNNKKIKDYEGGRTFSEMDSFLKENLN